MGSIKTVAIVSNTAWFIYNFHLKLLEDLQKEGYRVILIAPKDDYVSKIEERGVAYYDIKINNKGTHPIEDAKLIWEYRKLYKKIAPDVVLQFTIKSNIYGSMAAWMVGKTPVISTISGLGTVFLCHKLSSQIAKILYKITLRVPKKVFFLNTYDRELFISSRLVKAEKATVIPGSGIDTVKFKPIRVARSADDPIRFLLIGRLIKDKGIVEFVEAAKQMKAQEGDKVEFCILGSYYFGNPTAIKEEEIAYWEEEGIIKYLGSSDNVPSIIAQADCIVLPSYREGISQVLLEAASMEKPLIATDVPGCKEVVEEGVTGYLCRAKDAEDLREKIMQMYLLPPAQRNAMGRRGREKVIAEFEERVVNEKYLEAIASLCN